MTGPGWAGLAGLGWAGTLVIPGVSRELGDSVLRHHKINNFSRILCVMSPEIGLFSVES